MKLDLVRILRTPYSERFILRQNDQDAAAVDLHYLVNGTVVGSLIVFEDSGIPEASYPELMKFLDEVLLPDVKIENNNLFITAVKGTVLGNFIPEAKLNSRTDEGAK